MKTACGVIRDLLPLYAEKMTGEESNALIREHLEACKDCSAYLEALQQPMKDGAAEASSDGSSLRLVRRGIRSRKTAAVLFTALLVFAGMLAVFSRMVRPDYISFQDSGAAVAESGNGDVYVRFSDSVTSCRLIRSVDEENRSVVEVEAWTSLWDRILGKAAPSVLISSRTEPTDGAYYDDLSAQGRMTLLYGTDAGGGACVLPRLVPGYYFLAALIAAAVTGLARLLFRKNKKASRICGYLFAAPLSYLLGHLLVATGFTSFSAADDILLNCVAALALYGVLISGAFLLRQRRQDRLPEQKERAC